MTNLEALQSLTEYSNANLFSKVLTDNGVSGSGTYAAADEQSIDMCFADVLLYLAGHPTLSDGSTGIQYTPAALMAERAQIYAKWGIAVPGATPTLNGKNANDRNWW